MEHKTTKKKLYDLGKSIFEKAGLSKEDAAIAAEVLATNDLRGVYSHGTTFFYGYSRLCKYGGADPTAQFSVQDFGQIGMADGHRGLGIVNAYKAMNYAIQTARIYGVGIVSVCQSTHAAAMGYYAMMAAENNMFGMAMSNSDPVMSIPGTKGRVIGNNPFAYAAPVDNDRSILFDVAMSSISGGKIKNFEVDGKELPEGWLVDADGNPARDPAVFRKGGTLLPFAMHKGYGFAVMVEILSAVISGSGMISENVDWFNDPMAKNDIGHFFLALDIEKFMPIQDFKIRMSRMIAYITNAQTISDNRVLIPGEMEMDLQKQQLSTGIILSEAVYDNIRKASEEFGLEKMLHATFE